MHFVKRQGKHGPRKTMDEAFLICFDEHMLEDEYGGTLPRLNEEKKKKRKKRRVAREIKQHKEKGLESNVSCDIYSQCALLCCVLLFRCGGFLLLLVFFSFSYVFAFLFLLLLHHQHHHLIIIFFFFFVSVSFFFFVLLVHSTYDHEIYWAAETKIWQHMQARKVGTEKLSAI